MTLTWSFGYILQSETERAPKQVLRANEVFLTGSSGLRPHTEGAIFSTWGNVKGKGTGKV